MKQFKFGQRSVNMLATVKPEMQELAIRALFLSSIDFAVVQGNRTIEMQQGLFGKGRSAQECAQHGVPPRFANPSDSKVTNTMNSNHIGGNAIDIAPFVDGHLNWDEDGKLGVWPKLAAAFKMAGAQLEIEVYWGGDFHSFKDRPHFSLVPG